MTIDEIEGCLKVTEAKVIELAAQRLALRDSYPILQIAKQILKACCASLPKRETRALINTQVRLTTRFAYLK